MITKRILIVAIICMCLLGLAYGQNFKGKDEPENISNPLKQLTIGERLIYSLQWLGIPVGRIILEVKEISNIDNHLCYHVIAEAKPNRFFKKFYDVEYVVHTYIDIKEFYPYRFEKRRRLKGAVTEISIDFNRDKNEAVYTDILNKKSISIRALSLAQDLLSSLYYFRLQDVRKGSSYKMTIVYGKDRWNINANVNGIYTMDIRKLGSFDVFAVHLNSELSQIILGRRQIDAYFTNDSRRLPIKFLMHSLFGPVTGILTNIPD